MTLEYKIAVCGSGGTGKSAITVQLVSSHFIDTYDPTLEDAYRLQMSVDNNTVILDILDTAGQEEYSALRESYMRTGQGFIIVYSVVDRLSFEEASKFYHQIVRVKEDLPRVPLVLVGNKIDLGNDRQVTTEEGKALATQFAAAFIETSAKNRVNIVETFEEMVREINKVFYAKNERRRGAAGGGSGSGKKEGGSGRTKCRLL